MHKKISTEKSDLVHSPTQINHRENNPRKIINLRTTNSPHEKYPRKVIVRAQVITYANPIRAILQAFARGIAYAKYPRNIISLQKFQTWKLF